MALVNATKALREERAIRMAHARALNRCAPNWTAHLDTLEWWLVSELNRQHTARPYIGHEGGGT